MKDCIVGVTTAIIMSDLPENMDTQNNVVLLDCGILDESSQGSIWQQNKPVNDTYTDSSSNSITPQFINDGTFASSSKKFTITSQSLNLDKVSEPDGINTLANIDKKISDIEAAMNFMQPQIIPNFPSSGSRIVFESDITGHDEDLMDNDRSISQDNINDTNIDDFESMAGSEHSKYLKVNIFTEDSGPKMYHVKGNNITLPLIPKKLPEAFRFLPVFGRPKSRAELKEFQMEKIKAYIGCDLNDNEFQTLSDYCSPEHLKTGKEMVMDTVMPGLGCFPMERKKEEEGEPGTRPELNLHRQHQMRKSRDTKNIYMKRMRYRGIRMIPLYNEEEETALEDDEEPLEPGNDLIFVFRIYRPFTYNPLDKFLNRTRHSVFSNDIVLLGRQTLDVLRDRILCCNDVDMRVDMSENPDDLPSTTSKDVFPSGFLFINNVFYVDTRKDCKDYSAGIRQWAEQKGIGQFKCEDMCKARLDELAIKLGHPEVYVHQGGCEHLFALSALRLAQARDAPLAAFPRAQQVAQNQTVYCTTCAEFAAKWIVVGSSRVPFDPAFFCDKCFKLYMYKDGKKIEDFKAYLYRGNEVK